MRRLVLGLVATALHAQGSVSSVEEFLGHEMRADHVLAAAPAAAQGIDSDGDGLSDTAERHKYLTDPAAADSDGDGVPDGDWIERREYTYSVRSVVQVMKPVTTAFLNDDYQDARLLDETATWVKLEVVHYPFNTVADAIEGDAGWRRAAAEMAEWLNPGPTADWTPEMRRDLVSELAGDGIDVDDLDDRQLVERVSRWLMQRAEFHGWFSTFVTAFDGEGSPFVPEELRVHVVERVRATGLSLEQQWSREISARGMFEQRLRGSCTSSAIRPLKSRP